MTNQPWAPPGWAPPTQSELRDNTVPTVIATLAISVLGLLALLIGMALPGANTCPTDSEHCYEVTSGEIVRASRTGFATIVVAAGVGAGAGLVFIRKNPRVVALIMSILAGFLVAATVLGFLADGMARAFNASV